MAEDDLEQRLRSFAAMTALDARTRPQYAAHGDAAREAADRLKRYREALEKIVKHETDCGCSCSTLTANIARQALQNEVKG